MDSSNDIPLLIQELTNESAAAISGGGWLRPLPRLPSMVDREMSVFPRGGGNGTETNSDAESILAAGEETELAREETEQAKELLALIRENF